MNPSKKLVNKSSKPGGDISISPKGENDWEVCILFSSVEASEQRMLERLREAKDLIVRDYNVSVERLELLEVLNRSQTTEGFEVTISIGKIDLPQGKPEILVKSRRSPAGQLLKNMAVELNLFHLDESGKPVTVKQVISQLESKEIDLQVCDLGIVQNAVNEVNKYRNSIQKLQIASGVFPDEGTNAEMKLGFAAAQEETDDLSGHFESRKVKKGDLICQKIPPGSGHKPGKDVFGNRIEPLEGFDFNLLGGVGTKLSGDRLELFADTDGVARVSQITAKVKTTDGERQIPQSVSVSVKQVVNVKAESVSNLVLEDSVEIDGSIGRGVAVTTQGEVLLKGNMGSGAVVRAIEDVVITGEVDGGEISSDSSIYSNHNVRDTRITAGFDVNLSGVVEGSRITGEAVKLIESRGAHIIAGSRVEIMRVRNDSKGQQTRIQVGNKRFCTNKLNESKKAVAELSGSLMKICDLFGTDTILRLDRTNAQYIFLQYLKKIRLEGKSVSKKAVNSMRSLLDGVKPLKTIIAKRSEEIEKYKKKAAEVSDTRPQIAITEQAYDPIEIIVNEKAATIKPFSRPVIITTTDDGDIKASPFR
ncbi:hypothetical protein CEE37_01765 [candidate division LCP-89 bacterium B3_LCP]|uniref:Flagellar Assembly Protein A N-terminal region domain-containing protein n=1 Tax=candidate division LCP-89 bacterium B3_LCP TaxID=2012998 RepID=A0A532V5E9_UNCL8|nr:MAG: hypothetical protein CEE37_01765 [candidate division LCP-89 bacterium B3_LCP]